MDDLRLLLGAWLAAASVVAFALAVADKRRARRGRPRVPEAVFHGLALLGGWPGGLAGFALARHKTRKARFLVPFLLLALANLAVLVFAGGRWGLLPG